LKYYEITIKPTSPFGTPLKGDTLFGHFCWQVAYDPGLVTGGLEGQLSRYKDEPFAVFSSAFPKLKKEKTEYFFPRPEVAMMTISDRANGSRKDRMLGGKLLKRKKWMVLQEIGSFRLKNVQFLTGEELKARFQSERCAQTGVTPMPGIADEMMVRFSQSHNTIDRLTGTTGKGRFAPYAKENFFYWPGLTLAIFVLLDEAVTDIDRVRQGIEKIGAWGFGRDASIGLGRFDVVEHLELPLPNVSDATACYTLAPSVPEKGAFSEAFFSPFVRFGKHGGALATGKNAFKRPVVMADEGSVLIPGGNGRYNRPWLGSAVHGVSYFERDTITQGYSPWLPINLE
jgi:CRISPR-associated protein Csm4